MNLRKICVAIVNWNGWKDTIECLESSYRPDYPEGRIVVVDNGSTDGSVEHICAGANGNEQPCLDRWVQRGPVAQVNASGLDCGRGDDLAQGLMDRGLVACTAMDARDAAHRMPRSVSNEGSISFFREGLQ